MGSLPDIVAGATGEDMIVEEFRKMYEELYNSLHTRSEMDTLGEKIQNMISGTCMEPGKEMLVVAIPVMLC